MPLPAIGSGGKMVWYHVHIIQSPFAHVSVEGMLICVSLFAGMCLAVWHVDICVCLCRVAFAATHFRTLGIQHQSARQSSPLCKNTQGQEEHTHTRFDASSAYTRQIAPCTGAAAGTAGALGAQGDAAAGTLD